MARFAPRADRNSAPRTTEIATAITTNRVMYANPWAKPPMCQKPQSRPTISDERSTVKRVCR